jgi:hypothetical protein
MTESPEWWKRQNVPAKALTVIASLCVLEIGLCSALPNNSKIWPFLTPLFLLTIVALFVAFVMWLNKVFYS